MCTTDLPTEGGKRKSVRDNAGEVEFAEAMRMTKRRVDLRNLGRRKRVQIIGSVTNGCPSPGSTHLRRITPRRPID
jgi:hypothetical protein